MSGVSVLKHEGHVATQRAELVLLVSLVDLKHAEVAWVKDKGDLCLWAVWQIDPPLASSAPFIEAGAGVLVDQGDVSDHDPVHSGVLCIN